MKRLTPWELALHLGVATVLGWAIATVWNTNDKLKQHRVMQEVTFGDLEREQVIYDK